MKRSLHIDDIVSAVRMRYAQDLCLASHLEVWPCEHSQIPAWFLSPQFGAQSMKRSGLLLLFSAGRHAASLFYFLCSRLTSVVFAKGRWRIALLAVEGGLSATFALTACAPIVPVAASRLSLLADAISYVQSGKSLSDHALSGVTGTECRTFNVALGRPICAAGGQVASVEERDPSSGVNAEAQFSTSARMASSIEHASIPDAVRAATLPAVPTAPIERFDCVSGTPDWHARIAFEAQDGRVLGFAYYSKWKPRTCSIHLMRDTAGSTWHTARDDVVHVDTPQGRFVIRTSVDAYVFEFRNVQRGKFCGMPGEINGTMTIKRDPAKPDCSLVGIMDTNDSYLNALYGSAPVQGSAVHRSLD